MSGAGYKKVFFSFSVLSRPQFFSWESRGPSPTKSRKISCKNIKHVKTHALNYPYFYQPLLHKTNFMIKLACPRITGFPDQLWKMKAFEASKFSLNQKIFSVQCTMYQLYFIPWAGASSIQTLNFNMYIV